VVHVQLPGKRRDGLRISVWYRVCRAECNRVALRRRRRYIEIARGIVERIAIDRRTGLLENRSPVVRIPMHVIAGLRRSIWTRAAVVWSSIFAAEAVASDHISRFVQDLLCGRARGTQIDLAGGVGAVRRLWVIEFDRQRKIEGVHQADVVVVAARGRARESKFGQACISRPGMLTLEQSAAVSGRARPMPGAVKCTLSPTPEASADPGYRD
jgi:hypothetical protein